MGIAVRCGSCTTDEREQPVYLELNEETETFVEWVGVCGVCNREHSLVMGKEPQEKKESKQ